MKSIIYAQLFVELYNDFKKETQISKVKSKLYRYFVPLIILTIFSILLQLAIIFFKCNIPLIIIISIINYFNMIIIYLKIVFYIKASKKEIKENYFKDLDLILKKSTYKSLNSLSKLNELENFLIQQQNSLLSPRKQNNSFLITIVIFLITTTLGFFITELFNSVNLEGLILLLKILIFIVCIFIISNILIDLYHLLKNHDDDEHLTHLLDLIREQKLKIIDSKDKNIASKIEYILKLGKFS